MTRDEWLEHLRRGTGPLSLDHIETLEGDAELVSLLRDSVRPPWPDVDEAEHPADRYLPVMALNLLGFLQVEAALDDLMAAQYQAEKEHWDWILEAWPYVVAHIGPASFAPLKTALLELEADPSRDPFPPFYYMNLTRGLCTLALEHPELTEPVVALGKERLEDPDFSLKWAEAWLASNLDLRAPGLTALAPDFFRRASGSDEHEYASEFFGSLASYHDFIEHPFKSYEGARHYLLNDYRRLRQSVEQELNPPPQKTKPAGLTRITTPNTSGEPIRKDQKVGRNEPCPCGSGKKYKHCCGSRKNS